MDGANRVALVIIGCLLPIANFILLRQLLYDPMTHVVPVWGFNVVSCLLGLLVAAIFFSFAIDTPIEAVVISSILLVLVLMMRSMVQSSQARAHKMALQSSRAKTLTPKDSKPK